MWTGGRVGWGEYGRGMGGSIGCVKMREKMAWVVYVEVLVQNVLPRNVLPRNVHPQNVLPHNVLLDKTPFRQNVLLYKMSMDTKRPPLHNVQPTKRPQIQNVLLHTKPSNFFG